MVHRLGRMLIGETSVAVIVTAPAPAAPPSRPRWKASTGSRNWCPSGRRNTSSMAKCGWKESGIATCTGGWLERPRRSGLPRARRLRARTRPSSAWTSTWCASIATVKNQSRPTGGRAREGRLRSLRQRRAAGDRGLRAADRPAALDRPDDRYQRLHRQGSEVRDRFGHPLPARPLRRRQSRTTPWRSTASTDEVTRSSSLHPQLSRRWKPR